jgi:sugar lactone lactonase YvrE
MQILTFKKFNIMRTMRQLMTALLLLICIEGFGGAGPNQTICLNSNATMAATGIGTWVALPNNPASTTIDTPTLATTMVSGFNIFGIYGFKWGSAPGDTMYITVAADSVQTYSTTTTAICAGSPDTFIAIHNPASSTDSFQWYKNGVAITGATGSIYSTSAIANGDYFYAILLNSSCQNTFLGTSGQITVNPNPSMPALSLIGGCLGSDSLELSGLAGATQLNWYLNGVPTHTTPFPAYTVAGGNNYGSAANQLYNPKGVFVDASGYIYVADQLNQRIQKFPAGSTSATNGVTVAGGNGYGSAANQFKYPNGVFADGSGNIYVVDEVNQRIQKFPAGSTSATNGVTVAGGNGLGSAANQFNYPSGVFVDGSGNIYVADNGNNRIQKFPSGSTSATNGVTVAGGNGAGSSANQLNYPYGTSYLSGIYMDGNGNIYTADYNNNRVQKFPAGSTSATNGVTIAGGNGSGNAANQFAGPSGVFVDGSGNIYVADYYNSRVQKFPAGSTSATNGVTVAGGNGAGSAVNQLYNPTDVFVDGSGNIYVADIVNERIQKWNSSTIDSFYTPTTVGSYTATIVGANGCTSAISDTVTIAACLDTVWPGDADANRMVGNVDLLTIGLGYDSTGPMRTVQGIVWQGDVATEWAHNFTIYAPTVNFNHADCNGDGIINADDTLAIVTNFGDTHAKTGNLPGPWRSGTPGISLLFSKDTVAKGDTLTTSIILGSTSVSVNNIYGLAFTFNYDPFVDTLGSFSFVSSWLGSASNSININRNFTSTGAVKAAITGINHTSRSGNGEIATFRCIITTDNINGKNLSYFPSAFYISDITAIDEYGNPVPLNAGIDTNYVAFTPNGIRDISQTAKVTIYPNPASTQVMIKSGAAMSSITITDMPGQEVLVQKVNSKQSEIIDISNLSIGVYIVHVSTISGEVTVKLIINR